MQPIEQAASDASQPANNSGPQHVMTEAEMRAKIEQELDEINKRANGPVFDHESLAKAQGVFIARQGIFIQNGDVGPYIEAQEIFAVEQSHHLMTLDRVQYSKLLADFIAMQANLLHDLGAI
jgi:hypothetical protein